MGKNNAFICPICKEGFQKRDLLDKHIKDSKKCKVNEDQYFEILRICKTCRSEYKKNQEHICNQFVLDLIAENSILKEKVKKLEEKDIIPYIDNKFKDVDNKLKEIYSKFEYLYLEMASISANLDVNNLSEENSDDE